MKIEVNKDGQIQITLSLKQSIDLAITLGVMDGRPLVKEGFNPNKVTTYSLFDALDNQLNGVVSGFPPVETPELVKHVARNSGETHEEVEARIAREVEAGRITRK